MKAVIPVIESATLHPKAGLLEPGKVIHLDDNIADMVIEAGLCKDVQEGGFIEDPDIASMSDNSEIEKAGKDES